MSSPTESTARMDTSATAAPRPMDGKLADQPLVSFVIPVRNDPVRLRGVIATIKANTYPAARVEIVVADNGSTDDTAAAARALGARVLSLPGLSVAALRNTASSEAKGEVLAFVDADHEIDPAWIASAVEDLDQPGVAMAGALCLPPRGGTWVQRMYDGLRGRTVGRHDVEWLGSGNMAVRRREFEKVSGFDESLETCEDVDLCQRLRATGARLIGDERLKNVHLGDPATLGALFRGELWRGRDNFLVSMRAKQTLRGLPSILFPMFSLVCLMMAVLNVLAVPFVGRIALFGAVGMLLFPLALAGLRALRIIANARLVNPIDWVRAYVVALTYDTARTLALLMRAGHHRPRQR